MDSKKFKQTLGKNVRKERKKQDFSIEELAHLAGIDASTLERIENGYSSPHHETIYKIAEALDVSVDSFHAGFRKKL